MLRVADAVATTLLVFVATSAAVAGSPSEFVPPPLSVARASYLALHPAQRAEVFAKLPHALSVDPQATRSRAVRQSGGTWSAVSRAPAGLTTPLLLTDGTVIAANGNTPDWYKLTPDAFGNYAHGTWSQIASLPVIGGTQYAPLYHASAVLPDGRVIVMGGEYNGSNTEVWTNLGAIYDPIANSWAPVAAPAGSGWSQIGDAQSVVLANGKFMLASCCGSPDTDALLDPVSLTWTSTGAPNAGAQYQDEQGYELLPTGHVLTLDIWTNYAAGGNATNAEQYSPATATWSSAGNTPVSLVDPYVCGNFEIGPAVLRSSGTVVAFGGNTGCTAPATDPTALYVVKTNTWKTGPNLPSICGGGTSPCDLADAGAALLPDGTILFDASAGYGQSPTHFFQFTPKNATQQVSDPLFNASTSGAFYYNFLMLPNGQTLMTDFSSQPELYTYAGAVVGGTAPVITSLPGTVVRGTTYTLQGKQLSGRSQGAYYGDDSQTATNYPIVRITNTATGHVFYARTSNFTSMSVASGVASSTKFLVSAATEAGAGTLAVIANGVASAEKSITVQ